jgi:hypothetical protein
MLDQTVVAKLKETYSQLHPLLFHRSLERSKTNGDLFDIIDTVPKVYPLLWNEEDNRWSTVSDPYLIEQFLSDFK